MLLTAAAIFSSICAQWPAVFRACVPWRAVVPFRKRVDVVCSLMCVSCAFTVRGRSVLILACNVLVLVCMCSYTILGRRMRIPCSGSALEDEKRPILRSPCDRRVSGGDAHAKARRTQ